MKLICQQRPVRRLGTNMLPSGAGQSSFVFSRTILDLCGGTGSWSAPYREAGYNVKIIDPLADGSDVRLFKKPGYWIHGILAAPPCTHLSVSGARWWEEKGEQALLEALAVVDACLRIVWACRDTLAFWSLENPVGRLVNYLGEPSMCFDPCDYGDPYTKKTLLWGQFNHPIKNPVEPIEGSKMHLLPPSEDRWRIRSTTPTGFSRAFFEANP